MRETGDVRRGCFTNGTCGRFSSSVRRPERCWRAYDDAGSRENSSGYARLLQSFVRSTHTMHVRAQRVALSFLPARLVRCRLVRVCKISFDCSCCCGRRKGSWSVGEDRTEGNERREAKGTVEAEGYCSLCISLVSIMRKLAKPAWARPAVQSLGLTAKQIV